MSMIVSNPMAVPLDTPWSPKTGPSFGGSGGVAYPTQPSQSSQSNGLAIGLGIGIPGACILGYFLYKNYSSTAVPSGMSGGRHSRRKHRAHHSKNKTRRA